MFHRRDFLRTLPAAVGSLAPPVLVGCGGRQPLPPPPPVLAARPEEVGKPLAEALVAANAAPALYPARPLNILALSGGGQYASYNAGVLIGWTAAGTRPTFDVVTGISSGALVAVFAFLGPKYDEKIQRFFTTIRDKDIYAYRPAVQLLRNQALADPARLERLIAAELNDEFFADLCVAHRAGRRLYLGTMNAQTRRLTVWDVGALACCGRADAAPLVRSVVLATAAIPGLLPSVKFDVEIDGRTYREEHVDGGAASQAFLRLGPAGVRPPGTRTGWLAGSNLYLMATGKLYAEPLTEQPGLVKRATSTLSAALYALFRAEAVAMYAFCGVSGMKFHLASIAAEVPVPSNSFTFNPPEMQRLFAVGYQEGLKGGNWRLTPPGAEAGEEEAPRGADGSGVRIGR
jgi:hypothetical protein